MLETLNDCKMCNAQSFVMKSFVLDREKRAIYFAAGKFLIVLSYESN